MSKVSNNQVVVSFIKETGEWKVKQPSNDKASGIYETKKEAVGKGRDIARNQGKELVVKNMDGTINYKDSRDPRE
jgi:hypothetical protein